MKVLYIIDTLSGYGAEKSILQIAHNLKYANPVFIQLYKGAEMGELFVKESIDIHHPKLEENETNSLEKLVDIVKLENPKIIHSTLFRADQYARKLKKIFPSIILVGSFVSNSYCPNRFQQLSFISKLKLRLTQIRDRVSAKNVDYFISNSHAIKESNMRTLGIPSNKVKVIYRGRSFGENTFNKELISKTRKELGIEDDKKIFLNVARLSKGKGQLDLVRAFKSLSDNNANVVLLLVGDGALLQDLQDLIESLQLENKVILLGYRNDIEMIHRLANFFVFPSYFEGLSGALIEAIMSKLPCIISDIPENMECFPSNSNLNFPPGNIAMLANKMAEALNVNDWNIKTEKAYRYAQLNFDIKGVSKQYDDFYKEIYLNSIKII